MNKKLFFFFVQRFFQHFSQASQKRCILCWHICQQFRLSGSKRSRLAFFAFYYCPLLQPYPTSSHSPSSLFNYQPTSHLLPSLPPSLPPSYLLPSLPPFFSPYLINICRLCCQLCRHLSIQPVSLMCFCSRTELEIFFFFILDANASILYTFEMNQQLSSTSTCLFISLFLCSTKQQFVKSNNISYLLQQTLVHNRTFGQNDSNIW